MVNLAIGKRILNLELERKRTEIENVDFMLCRKSRRRGKLRSTSERIE